MRVANRGESRGSVARPVLISGDARVKTDPNQDSSKTNIRSLGSGKARTVTLIFETAGEVTERLEKTERVRVIIAGRELNADLTIGSAVESDAATSEDASPGADTQP